MSAQNKPRSSSDAYRHSSKLKWPNSEILTVVPREGAWWCRFHCSGCALPLEPLAVKHTKCGFIFHFFPKGENPLQISVLVKTGTIIDLS